MIRVMNINNIDKFLKMTEETRGDVLINLPDGSKRSLRDDHIVREMLRAIPVKDADLQISLTDNNDLPLVMAFMMEDCA